ncbi:alpha/beta fold hydrolase [Streptomyces sp. NPDC056500]|uniref:alpha/beta fold hydrolase n=1 Tax=Streptomyces sp. NPDC056500 TaxID=3345840 RepID=UPI00368FE019
MSLVVCVHGIGQQFSGEDEQHKRWLPAMNDGLRRAGHPVLDPEDVACAFYGDLFRPPGRRLSGTLPPYDASDVAEGLESELLLSWWEEAARVDEAVVSPGERTLVRTPHAVQRALDALSGSSFFADIALRALIADTKQVRAYLTDPSVRAAAQERVAASITPRTRVVVAHSLGSVVAYETLAAHPEWAVDTLVTLGSPLGIRHLVYHRLLPAGGGWPGPVRHWTNIADAGDVVALVKDLAGPFGPRVENHIVHNGSRAHDVDRYLNTVEAGRAVGRGCHGN